MNDPLAILLIDADSDDRTLAAAVLQRALADAHIVEVPDALEFALALADREFALAISAQDLGWADGRDVLRAVKQRNPRCATVLFGHLDQTPDAGRGHRPPGTDAVLGKSSAGFVELPRLAQRLLSQAEPTSPAALTLSGSVLDHLPAGVFTLSEDGTLLRANRAFAATLGFASSERVLGRRLTELVLDADARLALVRRLEQGEALDGLAVTMRREGGGTITTLLGVWPAPGTAGEDDDTPAEHEPRFQGLLIDATPAPAAGTARGADPDREQIQVAAALFRELQDPLQLVAQYAHVLGQRYRDALEGSALEMLERTEAIALRLQSMLRGMVMYTSASRERAHPMMDVPLSDVLCETLADLQGAITAGEARIFAEPLPVVVGDRELLGLLFHALIDNALKYRSDEAPVIRIRAEERANDWLLTFEDNGIGIPDADAERVFELFARLHDPDAYPGEGVGLSVCRYVTARHGGDIWVRSARPHGATFLVTLSKHLEAARRVLDAPTELPAASATASGR